MTSELSAFAARLREFIDACSKDAANSPRHPFQEGTAHDGQPPRGQGELFNELTLALFALQFQHVAPYRRLCEARRITPAKVTRWTDVPAIPTSAFKEYELTSLAPAGRTTVFHSSGTTEQRPSRHFHCSESLALYEASLLSWWRAHLLAANEADPRLVILTPPPESAPHSSLVHMFDTLAREFQKEVMDGRHRVPDIQYTSSPSPLPSPLGRGRNLRRGDFESVTSQIPHPGLTLFPLPGGEGKGEWEQTIQSSLGSCFIGGVNASGTWTLEIQETLAVLRSASNCPVAIMGTAFSFVHLLDHLVERGLRLNLPPGSRVMETGGYKGRSRLLSKNELHRLVTEYLGVPSSRVVCEYGMSELSSQAYDRQVRSAECGVQNEDRAFRFPPWARAQIISPETGREVAEGETGLIRIYDLANVWSVMAIQTEDLAIRRGDGFELIGRATLAEPRGCSLLAR